MRLRVEHEEKIQKLNYNMLFTLTMKHLCSMTFWKREANCNMDENPTELVQLLFYKQESTVVQLQHNVCTVHH